MKGRAVGLLHGGALGDFVLSWHLLKAVQWAAGIPTALVWARSPMADTDAALWGLDSIRDIESGGMHQLFAEDGAAPHSLAAELGRCNLLLNFISDGESALTRNLGELAGGPVACVDPRPASADHRHITEQWRERLVDQGVDAPSVRGAPLSVPAEHVSSARRRLESLVRRPAKRIALVHPGSGGRLKCWELEGFLRLAAELEDLGTGVVFVTGPVEIDVFGEALTKALGEWPTIREAKLAELMALCGAADLCIGNDSGFSHLAAAAPNSTVLVVFGRTDPGIWRPLGERVRALGAMGGWPRFEQVASAARGLLHES